MPGLEENLLQALVRGSGDALACCMEKFWQMASASISTPCFSKTSTTAGEVICSHFINLLEYLFF